MLGKASRMSETPTLSHFLDHERLHVENADVSLLLQPLIGAVDQRLKSLVVAAAVDRWRQVFDLCSVY